jgi:hypothetical protein
MIDSTLKPEQALLILLSRLTFSKENVEQIQNIIAMNRIDWNEVFEYAIKNKSATLIYFNIKKLRLEIVLPRYLDDLLKGTSLFFAEKNKILMSELEIIKKKCKENNIIVAPVKGAFLLNKLYLNYQIRFSGDLDILISKKNVNKIIGIMYELGYVQGKCKNDCIVKMSRQEEILWKLNMGNLYPFVKLCEYGYPIEIKIDFRFSLDDRLDSTAVDTMLKTVSHEEMDEEMYLIHMCTHLYNEASNLYFAKWNKDINIIKFCDIREYILNCCDNAILNKAIEFAKKYLFEDALYYTFYYLKELYNDGYEDNVLDKLTHIEEKKIQEYKINKYSEKMQWKNSFKTRMFGSASDKE